jgi:hypothetical protein
VRVVSVAGVSYSNSVWVFKCLGKVLKLGKLLIMEAVKSFSPKETLQIDFVFCSTSKKIYNNNSIFNRKCEYAVYENLKWQSFGK